MDLRCKAGDLAEIIGGIDGLNKGKIVEVRHLEGFHSEYGAVWLIASRTVDLITEYGGIGKECHCADAWLKPIPLPGVAPKVRELELV